MANDPAPAGPPASGLLIHQITLPRGWNFGPIPALGLGPQFLTIQRQDGTLESFFVEAHAIAGLAQAFAAAAMGPSPSEHNN